MRNDMTTLVSSESNEWYTPLWVIEMVRQVIGEIDLDPASSPQANAIVGARHFYTQEQNGLAYTWSARNVFLNPPFGKIKNESLAGIWIERMAEQHRAGAFLQGIALTHTRAGYEWWEKLSREYPICMTREKINFTPATPREKLTGSKTSQTFFYFGQNVELFSRIFSRIGRIL